MGETSIEWTAGPNGSPGKSWNPLRARNRETGKVGWACVHVSPGCTHCYSESFNRFRGTGLQYRAQDLKQVETFLDPKTLVAPLSWKKPCRCFVCSMTDLFAEWVPFEQIAAIFGVMAACPQHTFQVLTKRPERAREFFAWMAKADDAVAGGATLRCLGTSHRLTERDMRSFGEVRSWPLSNVWLMTSVENQETADHRIPELLACPAVVRGISYEPALGPVDFTEFLPHSYESSYHGDRVRVRGLDWIIFGGESGLGARPCDMAWGESARDQCAAAGVPFFWKQCGARPWGGDGDSLNDDGTVPAGSWLGLRDRKGGDMAEWPSGWRVRQFPEPRA